VTPFITRRRRIRLGWLVGSATLAGGLVAGGLLLSNTASSPSRRASTLQAQEPYRSPPTVPLRGERRAAAMRVARAFVVDAVFRKNSAASFDLVTAALKQGYTRRDWAKGTIPVVPFPSEALSVARWKVDYAYERRAALDVLFLTKPASGVHSTIFTLGLEAADPSHPGHGWLVSSWVPAGGSIPPLPGPKRGPIPPPHPLKPVWFLVPGALVAIVVLLPLGLGLVGWRRRVRARRAYEAALPRLPEGWI
jgi:hypothetical protein